MKKVIGRPNGIVILCCVLFLVDTLHAQTAFRTTITIAQNKALPIKTVPDIGSNRFKSKTSVYPLKISTKDTLFFYNQNDRDFVQNGITTSGVKSLTRVVLGTRNAHTRKISYIYNGGRFYNYYYFCNAVNNGFFTVNGLTTKQNATFTVSYSSRNRLYTIIRNYNNSAFSEAVSNYKALANSLAADLNNFNGTEYLGKSAINVGNFYFFLNRAAILKTPVLSAGGPTTFNSGGSVTLTSTAPVNIWFNGGTVIAGATGSTYTATTGGTYSVKANAAGFNTLVSNTVLVTVNPVNVNAPLTVSGGKLTNHSGNPVTLAGLNCGVYHSGFADDLAAVSAAIKNNSKANAIRLIWESQNGINTLKASNPGYNPAFYTPANLDAAISTYINLHILPIVALHDLTDVCTFGGTLDYNSTTAFANYVTAFWTDPSIITILKKYQNNLVINLQNEWGATWDASFSAAAFINTYKGLIIQLRAAGINCPIMIDAPDGGANSAFMITNGAALIAADPIQNILLSVHTYWSQENGGITNCPADYNTYIDAIAGSGLPFVLGEVSDWAVRGADGADIPSTSPVTFTCPGIASANKYAVDYDAILTEASKKGVSFLAWSWYQDGNIVRNIYNQDTGININTDPQAGTWPTDILSSGKSYGLNNASIIPVF